jgi:hypothetical protein
VLLLLISAQDASIRELINTSLIFPTGDMTSPVAVRILLSLVTPEQDDVAPDENIGCFNLLCFDGNATLRLTFVNEQASADHIDRMKSVKEQAALVRSKCLDETRPVLTSEFRDEANRFLEMVALAAECGFVTPSVISSKAELVALIDEIG